VKAVKPHRRDPHAKPFGAVDHVGRGLQESVPSPSVAEKVSVKRVLPPPFGASVTHMRQGVPTAFELVAGGHGGFSAPQPVTLASHPPKLTHVIVATTPVCLADGMGRVQHCRDQAQQCRALAAEQPHSRHVKRWLTLARSYDHAAEHLEIQFRRASDRPVRASRVQREMITTGKPPV
jgi:hypothetical protein